ncbi:MAG: hypothetical protein K0U93_12790, partial [Gammaproteobacteria bacterium]|nr:hypothetical protein [Gammaproteobacteria bacterium]
MSPPLDPGRTLLIIESLSLAPWNTQYSVRPARQDVHTQRPLLVADADSLAFVSGPSSASSFEQSRIRRHRRDARWATRLQRTYEEHGSEPDERRLNRRWRAGPRGSYRTNFEPAKPFLSDELLAEISEGLASSFHTPIEDLFKQTHPTQTESLLNGLSVNFGVDVPLNLDVASTPPGNGSQGSRSGSTPTAKATIKYNPLSYWYFSATFSRYFDEELQAPWNGDFSYSFGYDDWHPYTLSLVYSNFGGNRLNPDRSKGERFTTFEEGSFNLA